LKVLLIYPLDFKEKSIESKLISIESLTYPLDLKGKSIESKLISIESLTENLMNPIFGFACHYSAGTTFSRIQTFWGGEGFITVIGA
jgi:hypothetical protein